MHHAPFVSIIIPTCNRVVELAECLQAVYSSIGFASVDVEVIVSDDSKHKGINDSDLGRPYIRYSKGPQKGPAANRNHGALLALGEWLLFCDDDCIPSIEWLAAYAQKMKGSINVLEGCTKPLGIRRRLDEECPANETGGYLWSCNFAIRKATYERLKGFDENFPAAAMEDVDLRLRLLECGQQIEFISSAILFHPWRPKKGIRFIDSHVASTVYLVKKHPAQASLISQKVIVKNFVRYILKIWLAGLVIYKGAGCFRDLRLQVYNLSTRINASNSR